MTKYLLLTLLFISLTAPIFSQLSLAPLFADHAILQRNEPITIWGTAAPNTPVVVSLADQKVSAMADDQGQWQALLPAHQVGGPFVLTVSNQEESIRSEDILFGDVWLCSGQSNMEWIVSRSKDPELAVATADDPAIRHYKVPHAFDTLANNNVPGEGWEVANTETVGDFTAVGYYFARHLRERYPDIPIGILNSSWGGSRIEPWIPTDFQAESVHVPTVLKKERKAMASRRAAMLRDLQKILPDITTKDRGMEAEWWKEDKDWSNSHSASEMSLPGLWERQGYPDFDGIAWYRTTVALSPAEAAGGATLHLGQIDDADITWVNGQQVGSMDNAYNIDRVYEVPASVLQSGQNTVTVRVDDYGGGGGFASGPDQLFLQTSMQAISLAKSWQFSPGSYREVTIAQRANQLPTLLYNAMIHPLTRFPVRGICWYQGESNTVSTEDAQAYAEQFQTLISAWRSLWGQGALPFLYVQIANIGEPDYQQENKNWAVLRASQTAALHLPKTHQALAIDIGEAYDVHPKNKQEVGRRLALGALALAYGEMTDYRSPEYNSYQTVNGRVRISFKHTAEGLTSTNTDTTLAGFELADQDGVFYVAKAQLIGNEVEVWHEKITTPSAVRYAWANNPGTLHLYNSEDLPATSFWVELVDD